MKDELKKFNELLREAISKGVAPDFILVDLQLSVTPSDGCKIAIAGTPMTKALYQSLEIDEEELDKLLKPAIECLKDFEKEIAKRIDEKKDNDFRKLIF